jgi:replication factor C small subunit
MEKTEKDEVNNPGTERNQLWVEKYRPKTVSDIVLSPDIKKNFIDMVSNGKLNNMTLCGSPGIGKTTLAKVLANEFHALTLFVPCGVDGNIDMVRNTVEPFCRQATAPGTLKVVILDEFDSASGSTTKEGSATNNTQKAMRSVIEKYQDCRFILTCNYVNKVISPILSRCPPVMLSYGTKDVAERMKTIFDLEHIEGVHENGKEYYVNCIQKLFPDIRKIVSVTQSCCSSGKLTVSGMDGSVSSGSDIENLVDELLAMIRSKDTNVRAVRKFLMNNVERFGKDYEQLVSIMLDKETEKQTLPDSALTAMINAAFRMSQVSDPEIQMFGLIIQLRGLC